MRLTAKYSRTAQVDQHDLVENTMQHESDSLFVLVEALKWTDAVELPGRFEGYIALRNSLADADLCSGFSAGIQDWVANSNRGFSHLSANYLCSGNGKVAKGAVTALYWMIDEVMQASRGLNYKWAAYTRQQLFGADSPLQDLGSFF